MTVKILTRLPVTRHPIILPACRNQYGVSRCRRAGRNESLREGEGYFYFGGGEAVNWLSNTVHAKKLSDLTLEQWLKEFDKLVETNKKLERSMVPRKIRK
jgi:hypothetical protein